MKQVLFIVPHEDDELFVGGPMILNLAQSKKYDTRVYIATNGDYYPFEHKMRIQESLDALEVMGVPGDHVYFGGYGDGWGDKHLYNSEDTKKRTSEAGKTHTYMDHPQAKDWAFQYTGKHNSYTRAHYREDIRSLIETLQPDIIIGVDMDSHRDHRCLSLLTDEALREVLINNPDYKPVFLKKYAYQGVMLGKNDFFHYPLLPTANEGENTSNPYFKWSDRIRYRTPDSCKTMLIETNPLYKISRIYKSQGMWIHAGGFINRDVVYWQRNVNNEVLHAKISVSSGNSAYLNDFKLVDSEDIIPVELDYSSRCWRPSETDTEKSIRISFEKPTDIKIMNIYFNCIGTATVSGEITFFSATDTKLHESRLNTTATGLFHYSLNVSVSSVKEIFIQFNDPTGMLGISEIECLKDVQEIPFQEFLYDSKTEKEAHFPFLRNVLLKLDYIWFRIRTIWYMNTPNSYSRKRNQYNKEHNR